MTPSEESHKEANGITVMVVDDDIHIRQLLTFRLMQEGYTVASHPNGKEALHALLESPESQLPAIILLDLRMPEMTGWKFRKRQKKHPKISHIPIVVITTESTFQGDLASIDASGFFKKPIQMDLLIRTINEHCLNTENSPKVA
ncbi:MAG: hypothetical protein CL678_11340 [Bdellovibrionaceae bacterium]|nr:hypothetical protein [Pseudobdellovibrionaceae bacterium]|tara:strand:- start:5614 stop:6045 length:432 start_codon:yes stop_codon:yes gene_type:complete